MREKVIAIFDIGKTNKKVIVFNSKFEILFQKEDIFETVFDEDGVDCDDIALFETWIYNELKTLVENQSYRVVAVNFATYGASLVYLDSSGKRITPVYNYLKPMPTGVTEAIYEQFGGEKEFSRQTASPALGMLNSGLQIAWLKSCKPDMYANVSTILHLPQYISYLFTNQIYSDYTSIGCHTAMWNFDNMKYHPWLSNFGVSLPIPIANNTTFEIDFCNQKVDIGIGIHDSSSSLAPYIVASKEKFLLLSTGTWCINMNPFNYEPLTAEQLSNDCLCYLSVAQKPVKSSRLFMGHIHNLYTKKMATHFGVSENEYQKVDIEPHYLENLADRKSIYFASGIPANYIDEDFDLSIFGSYSEAYLNFIVDLTVELKKSIDLILTNDEDLKNIYISGGFSRNKKFMSILASLYPNMKLFTSEIDNATALGAALMVADCFGDDNNNTIDLKLKPFTI